MDDWRISIYLFKRLFILSLRAIPLRPPSPNMNARPLWLITANNHGRMKRRRKSAEFKECHILNKSFFWAARQYGGGKNIIFLRDINKYKKFLTRFSRCYVNLSVVWWFWDCYGKKKLYLTGENPFNWLCFELVLTFLILNTSQERVPPGAVAILLLCSYYYVVLSTRLTIKRGFDGVRAFRGGSNKKKKLASLLIMPDDPKQ